MTLKEALESGKPFRRINLHTTWIRPDNVVLVLRKWSTTDVTSTDWEVCELPLAEDTSCKDMSDNWAFV